MSLFFTCIWRLRARHLLPLAVLVVSGCFSFGSGGGGCQGNSCSHDADCSVGEICGDTFFGGCVPAKSCVSNKECAMGEFCDLSESRPAPHPFEQDSPSTHVCRGRTCGLFCDNT